VSLRIKIYKRSLEVAVAPLEPSHTLAIKFPKKLLADLTLTIGCVLLLTLAFSIIYMFSSKNTTVDFSVLKFFYVLILPVAFNLFTILFYAKNVKARKTLLRELRDSFHSWIDCNQ
jgi:glucan phosphoethanolaminetransferase (alkaline phosphatase superfamily)